VIKPPLAVFPVMPLIEQVVEAERPLAAHKGLELDAVGTSAWVESDPALLERMLKNLITNAVRYTERGRIVVGCRRGEGRLRIEVLDTGIGIATVEQQRIFDEYYQIDGASGQGLGLGLPIVKSLGDLLGHAVAVRSAPEHGSVFSIEVPLRAPVAAPKEALVPSSLAAGGRVVLVDDDVEIRRSMQLLLEGWGYELVSGATLADVETALSTKGVRPDAAIVDYRLAGDMTGAQVIEGLRSSFGQKLPALVITGNANVAAVREKAPGLPIAVKPVSPGKLRAFLSETIGAARVNPT
jgi:CheY-like chemotaxis protein